MREQRQYYWKEKNTTVIKHTNKTTSKNIAKIFLMFFIMYCNIILQD